MHNSKIITSQNIYILEALLAIITTILIYIFGIFLTIFLYIGVIISILILNNPFWGLCIFVFLIITNIEELYTPITTFHIPKIFATLSIISFFLGVLKNKIKIYVDIDIYLIITFIVLITVSGFFAFDRHRSLEFFVNYLSKVIIMYILSLYLLNTKERVQSFINVIIFSLVTFAILCLIYHFFINSNVGQRLTYVGYSSDPNDISLTLMIALPLLIYKIINSPKRKLLYILGLVFILYVMILNKSRGGLLAGSLTVFITFLFLKKIKWTHIVLTSLAWIIVLSLADIRKRTDIDETYIVSKHEPRFYVWEAGYKMFMTSPLLGTGLDYFKGNYDNFGVVEKTMHDAAPHNFIIEVLAELGILGFIIYFLIYFRGFIYAYRLTKYRNSIVSTLFPGFAGLSIAMLFLSQAYFWLYFLILAIILRGVKVHEDTAV